MNESASCTTIDALVWDNTLRATNHSIMGGEGSLHFVQQLMIVSSWNFHTIRVQQENWSKDDKLQRCRFQAGEPVDNAWFKNCAGCFYGQWFHNFIIFVSHNLSTCWVTKELSPSTYSNPLSDNLYTAKVKIFMDYWYPTAQCCFTIRVGRIV